MLIWIEVTIPTLPERWDMDQRMVIISYNNLQGIHNFLKYMGSRNPSPVQIIFASFEYGY